MSNPLILTIDPITSGTRDIQLYETLSSWQVVKFGSFFSASMTCDWLHFWNLAISNIPTSNPCMIYLIYIYLHLPYTNQGSMYVTGKYTIVPWIRHGIWMDLGIFHHFRIRIRVMGSHLHPGCWLVTTRYFYMFSRESLPLDSPKTHQKWMVFWTPNIWVITPKNEGCGFPWYKPKTFICNWNPVWGGG